MDKDQLLRKKVSQIYLHFLLPTVLAAATHSLYCLVDVIFISIAAGSTGLAAMNLVMPVFTFFSAVALMLGVGGATTMSVCIGRGDHYKANKVLTIAAVSCVVVGALVSVLGSIFIVPFAYALGATDELLPYVLEYMQPVVATTFMYMLSYCAQVLVRSDNGPKLVMAATMSGNLFNIVFDYVFVMVFGWGIRGASLATAISPFLSVGIMALHYIKHRNRARFIFPFWDRRLFFRIFKNGVSTALLEASIGAVTLLFNIVLLRLGGQILVAAYAVISNIAFVGKSIFNGIAQAAQPIISVNYGAKLYRRVHQTNLLSLSVAAGISAVMYGAFLLFARSVVSIFAGSDTVLIEVSAHALHLYFSSLVFTAINTMLMYYFQSIEHAVISTFVSVCRGFVFVFLGLAVLIPAFDVDGVWLTMTFAELLAILFTVPLTIRTQRKLNREAATVTAPASSPAACT